MNSRVAKTIRKRAGSRLGKELKRAWKRTPRRDRSLRRVRTASLEHLVAGIDHDGTLRPRPMPAINSDYVLTKSGKIRLFWWGKGVAHLKSKLSGRTPCGREIPENARDGVEIGRRGICGTCQRLVK